MAGLQFSQLVAGVLWLKLCSVGPGSVNWLLTQFCVEIIHCFWGLLFFSTLMVVVANLITDFSYRLLDPRIK